MSDKPFRKTYPVGDPFPEVHNAVTDALGKQVGGSHYLDFAIQPLEFILANELDFLQGNVIKYVVRHKTKNGVEDIKKAIHYLELIKESYVEV
tara:strand:- start:24426 stop:24704 length:279 start_codon:yes stop_codon:yes gene_type:complete